MILACRIAAGACLLLAVVNLVLFFVARQPVSLAMAIVAASSGAFALYAGGQLAAARAGRQATNPKENARVPHR